MIDCEKMDCAFYGECPAAWGEEWPCLIEDIDENEILQKKIEEYHKLLERIFRVAGMSPDKHNPDEAITAIEEAMNV